MSDTTENSLPEEVAAAEPLECPLSSRDQTRNILLFGATVGLVYLAAPVVYVGITHANLLEQLGASKEVCNRPSSAYFWMTPIPIFVAWYFCEVRRLKPVLVSAFLCVAAAGGVSALMLVAGARPGLLIGAMIAHGGILGAALGVVSTYQWEMLGRGVSERRRGAALSLAYGAGPILAVAGSLATQLILDGKLGPLEITKLAYPWNYALLFGATVPIMGLNALLAMLYVVPPAAVESVRSPLVTGVFGGFGRFFGYPLIVTAAVSLILVSSGYNIIQNISLYTKEVISGAGTDYVGYQHALRFGFKIFAGFLLGRVLSKSNPKAGLLITAGFLLAGVVWARCATDMWILISFGLMGAGELFGVYYPNYILSCSAKSEMRRNMSFTSMLNMPTGMAATLFGVIADQVGGISGFFRSFEVSMAILVGAMMLVLVALPSHPRPRMELTD